MSDFKYFIMFQDGNYDEERSGGYLWAPQHWESMTKIEKGNIIFSVVNRDIVSFNSAKGACYQAEKWEIPGWMAAVEYNELKYPINLRDNKDGISFDEELGYLYEIDSKLGSELMDLVIDKHLVKI